MTTPPLPTSPILDAFRRSGHLEARLDPLGRLSALEVDELRHAGPEAERARAAYCGSIGVEFMHIPTPDGRRFVAAWMEAEPGGVDGERVLDLLLRGELFEQVLQARYLGNKRFSLEGVAALLPLLEEVLVGAAERGAEQAVLAMSHRGRLSVMAHLVGTPAVALFAGFEDVDPRSVLGGGDVKYHLGATGTWSSPAGREVRIHLVSNPSHLEAVVPVAMGRVRAKEDRLGGPHRARVLPILVHGDSAFAGQGIVAESLNLETLEGYTIGGSIHVVANNLIGFTTEPDAYASTRYATDVALRLGIPIIHVNGEDPEAVVRATRLAVAYRYEFGRDVVLDLIGYRRHGHSEIDDPTITQPRLYARIAELDPLSRSYGRRLGLSDDELDEREATIRDALGQAQQEAAGLRQKPHLAKPPGYWAGFSGGAHRPEVEVDTGVSEDEIEALGLLLAKAPDGFSVHPKVLRLLEQRAEMAAGARPIDFGMAEALAFATLVRAGVPVRLSGQDSRRGTFNHRHAVLVDTESEAEFAPVSALAEAPGRFEIYDSPLSEAAVLGYEYGYSRDFPEALVLWEAQFGDFANGGQIIIDQFIAAGEDKWGLLSGLVLLLPHGYEGQGPEHSSARLERFLQLAAEDNLQVCQPSTAGQYFHLLRRQALRPWRKPLVVFTPKSMLRQRSATSPRAELARPRFLEIATSGPADGASRLLFCSGKIGHELESARAQRRDDDTAIVFLEQLYPFPESALRRLVSRHRPTESVWVQEEPANQGALAYAVPRLERLVGGRLRTAKRKESASPATGSAKAHAIEQAALIELALGR